MLVFIQSPPHQHSLVFFSTILWLSEQMIVHKSENQSKNSRAADIGGSHNSFLDWPKRRQEQLRRTNGSGVANSVVEPIYQQQFPIF